MKASELHKARNPDLRASLAAMQRAAAMARKVAIERDTGIVIVRGGQRLHISAAQLREAQGSRDRS